jgi:hypothetical protein
MTDDDRFELELAALRPRSPSAELKRRIAEELAGTPSDNGQPSSTCWWINCRSWFATPLPVPHSSPARGYKAALVAGTLAASLLAAIVWRGRGPADEMQLVPTLEASVTTAFDGRSPSIWTYRSALLQSPDSLNDVLNEHDAHTLEHKAGGAPDLLAARFNSDLDSFLGEL